MARLTKHYWKFSVTIPSLPFPSRFAGSRKGKFRNRRFLTILKINFSLAFFLANFSGGKKFGLLRNPNVADKLSVNYPYHQIWNNRTWNQCPRLNELSTGGGETQNRHHRKKMGWWKMSTVFSGWKINRNDKRWRPRVRVERCRWAGKVTNGRIRTRDSLVEYHFATLITGNIPI